MESFIVDLVICGWTKNAAMVAVEDFDGQQQTRQFCSDDGKSIFAPNFSVFPSFPFFKKSKQTAKRRPGRHLFRCMRTMALIALS